MNRNKVRLALASGNSYLAQKIKRRQLRLRSGKHSLSQKNQPTSPIKPTRVSTDSNKAKTVENTG